MTKVRKSLPEDLVGLSGIFRSVYRSGHPFCDPAEIKRDLDHPAILSFTALLDDEIVGYGQLRRPEYRFLEFERQALEISRVATHSDFQGRGVGRALVAALLAAIEEEAPLFVFADMQTSDERSQKLLTPLHLQSVGIFEGLAPDFFGTGQAMTILMGMSCRRLPVYGRTLYVTPKIQGLVEFVCGKLGLKRDLVLFTRPLDDPEPFRKTLAAHEESFEQHFRAGGFHFGFVTIDLTTPEAPALYALAHEAGLTVEGLVPMVAKPDGSRSDLLMMRKVPPGVDETAVKLFYPGAQDLREILDGIG